MDFREELVAMKKEVKQIEQEEKSFAMQFVQSLKEANKRIITFSAIIIVFLIIAFMVNNLAWLWYINQYDFITETTTVDGGNGMTTYLENSNTGDLINGENN